MHTHRKLLVAVILFLLLPLLTPGQLIRDPWRRRTIGGRVYDAALEAGLTMVQIRRNLFALDAEVKKARQNYWQLYPDKEGFAEAETQFALLLRKKDFYIKGWYAAEGVAPLGQGTTGKLVDLLGVKEVDNGIDPRTREAFFGGWSRADETEPSYNRYRRVRDLIEFLRTPLPIEKVFSPQDYLTALLELECSSANIRGADSRDFEKEAKTCYERLVQIFGEKAVLDASTATMRLPKWLDHLLPPEPPDQFFSPFKGKFTDSPMEAFVVLLTKDSARSYVMGVAIERELRSDFPGLLQALVPPTNGPTTMVYSNLLPQAILARYGVNYILDTKSAEARVLENARAQNISTNDERVLTALQQIRSGAIPGFVDVATADKESEHLLAVTDQLRKGSGGAAFQQIKDQFEKSRPLTGGSLASLKEKIAQGDSASARTLAKRYFAGKNPEEWRAAVEILQPFTTNGVVRGQTFYADHEAIGMVAKAHYFGRGVPKDETKALNLFYSSGWSTDMLNDPELTEVAYALAQAIKREQFMEVERKKLYVGDTPESKAMADKQVREGIPLRVIGWLDVAVKQGHKPAIEEQGRLLKDNMFTATKRYPAYSYSSGDMGAAKREVVYLSQCFKNLEKALGDLKTKGDASATSQLDQVETNHAEFRRGWGKVYQIENL